MRESTLLTVANGILSLSPEDRPARIAVDGVDGAGKTCFSNELADILKNLSVRPVIRASVDGFHHPRHHRYQQGKFSPEGFYRDSYNYQALKQSLLDPLSINGDRRIVTEVFDCDADVPISADPVSVPENALLLIDGIFLHRETLMEYWHCSVFLHVDFEVSVPRGNARFDLNPDPDHASNRRYVEGQQLYLGEVAPMQKATWVVDNNDLTQAHIVQR
ncbi:hypothetical protein [Saccharospirillum salsuginis]|uniref:Uridine kinase n=1 Tax=Saccharospirillum salsuginis TaxID=418750 RepID=A0A918KC95_9GAMM|nr:hypothetical protein [Saccharospirillum salsuginis]GGX58339.1 hypothetical protein GCM10007392_27710 [Saccharospirillum salsuginis]